MVITARVDDHGLSRKLAVAMARVRDKRPAMIEIGDYMVESTHKNFDQERAPDGWSWPRRKRVRRIRGGHLAQRATRIFAVSLLSRSTGLALTSYKLLQDTGRLLRSIHREASANSVRIGTNVAYSRVHQFGYPQRNIPARTYLGLRPEDIPAIIAIGERWQRRELMAAGISVR